MPLLQRRVERREFGIDLGTEPVNRCDDHSGDAGGDEAILDGSGAARVGEKVT